MPLLPASRQRRQSGAGCAVGRHLLGRSRLGLQQPHRLFQRHLAGRHCRRRFRRDPRLPDLRQPHPLHPALRRRHSRRPPLHERAALGGAHQADRPAQGRSPRGGWRPSKRTPAWPPARMSFSMRPCAVLASCGSRTSGSCSTRPRLWPRNSARKESAWRSSPTAADREPWPPTVPATSRSRSPNCHQAPCRRSTRKCRRPGRNAIRWTSKVMPQPSVITTRFSPLPRTAKSTAFSSCCHRRP
jgi:hypothetical protein